MAVSSKLITWRGNQGTAEASDLGWRPGEFPEAFEVKSTRTGHTERFEREQRKFFAHEFCGFYYRSVDRPLVLAVLND